MLEVMLNSIAVGEEFGLLVLINCIECRQQLVGELLTKNLSRNSGDKVAIVIDTNIDVDLITALYKQSVVATRVCANIHAIQWLREKFCLVVEPPYVSASKQCCSLLFLLLNKCCMLLFVCFVYNTIW